MKTIVKSITCLTGMLMLTSPAFAQQTTPMLDQGTKELSVSGRLELPDFEKIDYDIDTSYGYFIRDGWEIGFQLAASDFGGTDRLDATGFTEYNFNRESNIVPYVGGALGLATVDFDDGLGFDSDLDDDGWVFNVETGIKWFLRPYMAITTSIDFKVATDDIFSTGDEIEDNLTSIRIGMRFYF